MNVYFIFSVFDRNFEYLATQIRRDFPESQFFGFAYNRTKALKNKIFNEIEFASDLRFTVIDSSGDTFLSQVEKKFGVLVSELIHLDRHSAPYPKQVRKSIAHQFLRIFLESVKKHKIDMIISEGVDDLVSVFALKYCQLNSIPFVAPMSGRQGASAILCEQDNTEPAGFLRDLESARHSPASEEIAIEGREYIRKYIENQVRPHYTTSGSLMYRSISLKDLTIALEYSWQYFTERGHHHSVHPLALPIQRFRRVYRRLRYRWFLRSSRFCHSDVNAERYFVYPIHFHPEAATLVMGRRFHNQVELVKAISQSLPYGYRLLVKEHRVNLGRRPLRFYKEITDFHNVELVSDEANVFELVKSSAGIVTISSSMALEALMLRRPVLTIGTPYYNTSRNVFRTLDFAAIPERIKQMLQHTYDVHDTELFFGVLSRHLLDCGNITQYHGINRTAWNTLYDRIRRQYLDPIQKALGSPQKGCNRNEPVPNPPIAIPS